MKRLRPLLLLLFAFGGPAVAHDADVIYVDALWQGPQVTLVVTLTAQTLGRLAPVDDDGDGLLSQSDLDARAAAIGAGVWDQAPVFAEGVPCARDASTARVRDGFVQLEGRFSCGPGEVRQDFRVLQVLPANYRVTAGRFGASRGGPTVQLPSTGLLLRAAAGRSESGAPAASPGWLWLVFLLAPLLLVLVERRSK